MPIFEASASSPFQRAHRRSIAENLFEELLLSFRATIELIHSITRLHYYSHLGYHETNVKHLGHSSVCFLALWCPKNIHCGSISFILTVSTHVSTIACVALLFEIDHKKRSKLFLQSGSFRFLGLSCVEFVYLFVPVFQAHFQRLLYYLMCRKKLRLE